MIKNGLCKPAGLCTCLLFFNTERKSLLCITLARFLCNTLARLSHLLLYDLMSSFKKLIIKEKSRTDLK